MEALLKTSPQGREMIKRHEGVRLKAYPDPGTRGEPWTIGVGHTSQAGPPSVTPGMTITAQQADEILAQDLGRFEQRVRQFVTISLQQHEFDALVSFDFNTGALNRATLTKKLNAGDRVGAADEFLKWTRAAGRTLPGLVRRRNEERSLFLHGDYGTGSADATSVLRRGAQGEAVRQIQEQLNALGYDTGGMDGIFGASTDKAIREFQAANGLAADGILGPRTQERLRALTPTAPPELPDESPATALEMIFERLAVLEQDMADLKARLQGNS